VACGKTTHDMREVGKHVIEQRFANVVKPFVGCHVSELRQVLDQTCAVITGSCALRMLLGSNILANDMNIVVPGGETVPVHLFITQTLEYQQCDTGSPVNDAFKHAVTRMTVFCKGNNVITVSESTLDDPFTVLLCSHTTADMTAMTPGGLVVLYPQWTLNCLAIMNQGALNRSQSHTLGIMRRSRFRLERTTNFLSASCEGICPTLWQKVGGHGRQGLVLDWDERFSIRRIVETSHIEWRLSQYCENTHCPFYTGNNKLSVRLPPKPMPGDLLGIRIQEGLIEHNRPVCDSMDESGPRLTL